MKKFEFAKHQSTSLKKIYYRQGYRLLGTKKHSAVKICKWTKESLRTNRACYKEQWYSPVKSHRCMQMTPFIECNHHCVYCWRLHSMDKFARKEDPMDPLMLDDPDEIVEEAILKRRELLLGFKGNSRINPKKLEEALKPTMMTMSLTGEPTLYPRISDLIVEAEKKDMNVFLVTNGTMPKVIENLNPLPFQLYVSVSAPDEPSFIRISRPLIRHGWKKMNKTLELFPSLNTRKVIRLTVIKGWNDTNYEGYANLIEKAKPTFIEVKAYEWVGESQKRLMKDAMPFMKDVRRFAEKISELTGYHIKGEFIPSGVNLLV